MEQLRWSDILFQLAETAKHVAFTCLFGPTASGKTASSLALARAIEDKTKKQAHIINADSMQVYEELRILSARPSMEEESQVPHHLFGYKRGNQKSNADSWAQDAKACIKQCLKDNQHPILVGGTGLYFRALLEGLSPIPEVPQDIETKIRNLPDEDLDLVMKQTGETHLQDRQRKKRAAAVFMTSGVTLSDWQKETPKGIDLNYDFLILWPERAWLYERIDQRFVQMIEAPHGALDEVSALLEKNYDPTCPLMRAIGVPELSAHIQGQASLDEAIALAQQATRRYAKRQFTWMRSEQRRQVENPNFWICVPDESPAPN